MTLEVTPQDPTAPAPVAAPVAPAPVAPVAPVAAAPEAVGPAPVEVEPAPVAKPWFQQRIDTVTREKWEERRAREQAEERIRQLEDENTRLRPAASAAATPAPQPQQLTPQQIDQIAAQRAVQLVDEQNFAAACNKSYREGKAALGNDFDTAIGNLKAVGADTPQYRNLLQMTTQLDNSPAVLHHLGTNMEEAMRVLSLPPMQMAVELTKMSNKVVLKKASKAPAPVNPLTPTGGDTKAVRGPNPDGEFESQEDYKAWREKTFKRR